MHFRDITGQLEIKKKLIQTVLDHRVSHAQLFFGPEGNEKLALAIAYAQFINCPDKTRSLPLLQEGKEWRGMDSCGVCPSCVKYQKLIHPDLHFIYPVATTKKVTKKPRSRDFIEEWRNFLLKNNYQAGLHQWYESIGIENKQGIINADDCHEIITTLSYKSYESEYKVMILWMVEKLFYAAAPKLLKILEEPPEKTLFILISEDPDQIISTIRSRTLMVKIPRSRIDRKTTEETSYFTTFRDWMRLCFARDYPGLVSHVAELSKIGRENQKNLLLYGLKIIQSCASVNFNNPELVVSRGEEMDFIIKISPFINSSNLLRFTELFNTALYHIERNAYPQALFLDVSFQVIRLFGQDFKKKYR